MKISYNWLKQFINTDKTPQELSLILTNIGLEVESLEVIEGKGRGLKGLIVGEVKTCIPHPNADKLKITTVDIGTVELLQIVCGAPNVAAGQKVIVAPVGCMLYPVSGDPFKINKSKIRGEVSEGMLCAEDEIGTGIGHDGIYILPEDALIGSPVKQFFNLNEDFLYEIGLTPNRSDAASHLGVARDIAAFLQIPIQLPSVADFKIDSTQLPIQVKLESPDVLRYASLTISDVEVKPSPEWLQEKLNVIGIRPINNIVDATNYVLHELGQPLHAFDANAIKGNVVRVANFPENTLFTTLDDVSRKLSAEDLIIGNETEPMCLAGVFGGKHSGVSNSTNNIFLESAYFSAVSIRKTSKRHSLKTDASFRYERGTDPDMPVFALKRAALLIKEIAGGNISSEIDDQYPNPVKSFPVSIAYQTINNLIGIAIDPETVKGILRGLSIEIEQEENGVLNLLVPPYRVDVTRPADVVEEILRIYGYNNIPIPSKINASLSNTIRPDKEHTQNAIADMLSANGFMEIWCNSLTKASYALHPENLVEILNPLSSDLNSMRQSMLHPAMESMVYNQNRKNSNIKFFEFGKTYNLIDSKYVESQRLILSIAGNVESEQWNQAQKQVGFYDLKAAVDAIMQRLGLLNFQSENTKSEELAYGIRYFRGDKDFVNFGSVNSIEKKKVGIEKSVFYADFDWDVLLKAISKNKIINKEVSKFPAVRRDLSLLIDQSVTFDMLKTIAFKTDRKLVKEVTIFDVYEGGGKSHLPEGKKSYALNFTLQDDEQTLTDKQIDTVMQKIIHNLAQNVNAEIRK